jgi:hypothetical protein
MKLGLGFAFLPGTEVVVEAVADVDAAPLGVKFAGIAAAADGVKTISGSIGELSRRENFDRKTPS